MEGGGGCDEFLVCWVGDVNMDDFKKEDIFFLVDEKFDFDFLLFFLSVNEDDEVFFGFFGYKERCIVVSLELNNLVFE